MNIIEIKYKTSKRKLFKTIEFEIYRRKLIAITYYYNAVVKSLYATIK